MNSIDPFVLPKTDSVDPQTVAANVKFWRRRHGLVKEPKFRNEPTIIRLSPNKVIVAIDQQLGKDAK